MADRLGTAHPLTEPGVWVERIGDRAFPGRLPALFLDRDGTINVDTDYPSNPAEIVLRDPAPDNLRWLRDVLYH